jgi:DNA mismatch repair protein MSH4
MLKSFVGAIKPVWQALTGASSAELQKIRQLCDPSNYEEVEALIKYALNADVSYATQAVEIRYQRVFAINVHISFT